jgi:prolyl-tRNA editing enzyme YbaK/EbsC (Cys-tRNA(Pro) deacylase)
VIDDSHAARVLQIVRANRRGAQGHGVEHDALVSAERLEATVSDALGVLEGWLVSRRVAYEAVDPDAPAEGRRWAARARRPPPSARALLLTGRGGPVLAIVPAAARVDVRAALGAVPGARFAARRGRAQVVVDERLLAHDRVACHSELREDALVFSVSGLARAGATTAGISGRSR